MMGSPKSESDHQSNEEQHKVTLTQDFYIGVFEVTQKQWERVMGNWPSYFSNTTSRSSLPVEQVSYKSIRGSSDGAAWPESGAVDTTSFMGKLRARTGRAFDLPTESQWEYAGRAGTTTALNSAKNLTDWDKCPNMLEVGRYRYPDVYSHSSSADLKLKRRTAKVGSYLPNQWGLYDIHGNVWEWCLDWYGPYPVTANDPKGQSSGSCRVNRGGSWLSSAFACRVAYRYFSRPGYASLAIGFRVALPTGQ